MSRVPDASTVVTGYFENSPEGFPAIPARPRNRKVYAVTVNDAEVVDRKDLVGLTVDEVIARERELYRETLAQHLKDGGSEEDYVELDCDRIVWDWDRVVAVIRTRVGGLEVTRFDGTAPAKKADGPARPPADSTRLMAIPAHLIPRCGEWPIFDRHGRQVGWQINMAADNWEELPDEKRPPGILDADGAFITIELVAGDLSSRGEVAR